jgi:hypothetical protein
MTDQTPDDKEWDRILRQAWITSSLERDKAIITLSSAGLALLVAFITRVTGHHCVIGVILFIGLVGFTASIIAGVGCLHVNRAIILRELKREQEQDYSLFDKILIAGFVVGVVSIFLIGLVTILSP